MLTDNEILTGIEFYKNFIQANEANCLDNAVLKGFYHQLQSLEDLSYEIKHNTDISIKAKEALVDYLTNENLSFIDKNDELEPIISWDGIDSIDVAIDVLRDYKISEYITIELEKNKDIHNRDNKLEYYTLFQNLFNSSEAFKEVCVKSRFNEVELDTVFINYGFDKYKNIIKYIPEDRKLIHAKDEAFNSSKHLTINKMEEKQTKKTVTGYIASISDVKKFDSGKEVINLSIGTNQKDDKGQTVFVNASVWFDPSKKGQDSSSFKFSKGNNVEVKGVDSIYKEKPVFTVFPSDVKLLENKKSETITVKGNIANDLKNSLVGDNKVTSFSLAVQKEGADKPDFVNVYGWEKNKDGVVNKDLYELSTGKKGDFVELSGYYKPNNYTDNNGKNVERNDLIITSYKTISSSLSRNSSQEIKDTYLINSLNSGNFKEVEVALKSGANLDLAKKHDITKHSEKQQKAINDVISRYELSLEKKNSKGLKM